MMKEDPRIPYKIELYKVQFPIESNEAVPLALIYNRDMSEVLNHLIDTDLENMMEYFYQKGWIKDKFKVYVAGYHDNVYWHYRVDLTEQSDQVQNW